MASASSTKVKVCHNCINYDWEQVKNRELLQRCAKCKQSWYCSKECQEEHWLKVHKFYCKKLVKAHDSKEAESVHIQADCMSCFNSMVKREDGYLLDLENTDLVCSWLIVSSESQRQPQILSSENNYKFPVPFKVGEMTLRYKDDTERAVALMQAMLVKAKLSECKLYLICEDLISRLNNALLEFRVIVWNWYVVLQPGYRLMDRIEKSYENSEIEQIIGEIDKHLESKTIDDYNTRLWKNIKLLHFIAQYPQGLLRSWKESEEHNKVSKIVLDEITNNWRLLSEKRMLEIITSCFGDLAKKCSGCKIQINIDKIFSTSNECENAAGFNYCFLFKTIFFVCGKEDCFVKTMEDWNSAIVSYYENVLAYDKCDGCGRRSKTLHRCGKCLTKYYCGTDCRDKDWTTVHRKTCMKGETVRKQKVGKQKREQRKEENFLDFINDS